MANQIDTDAKVIAGDDYGFGHPSICRLSTTIMLVGHINESDELEIHKSTNGGVNWTLKKTLSNASGSFNLIPMTFTKAGLVYQKNSNEFEVWVTTNAGENWTNKLDITTGILTNNKALLLYDTILGRLHIIWQGTNVYDGKYSDNDGDSWTDWSVGRSSDNLADIDINLSNNYIYISQFYGATSNNYYFWHDSSGTYVGASGNLGIAGNTYHDKNLIIDLVGNRYFVYIKRTTATSKEKLVIRRNEGSETDLFDPDSDNAIVKGSSSIGVDQDDNVYVYYTKTSDEKTYYRKYDALTTTWGAETELIGAANNRINTEKHVLDGSDKLHFVYYKQP